MKKTGCLGFLLVVGAVVALGAFVWRDDLSKLELRRFPARASWQLPERVIESLGIEPGDRVADLGAGEGYFTLYLAEAVGPEGTVYAVDVDEEALAELERKVTERGFGNVVVVRAGEHDPNLPDGEIDLVFLCNVYHHLLRQIEYFTRLRRDLAAGGRVAVVEPRPAGFARLVNPPGHATPLSQLHAELDAAGYRAVAEHDFLPIQSFMVFAAR